MRPLSELLVAVLAETGSLPVVDLDRNAWADRLDTVRPNCELATGIPSRRGPPWCPACRSPTCPALHAPPRRQGLAGASTQPQETTR